MPLKNLLWSVGSTLTIGTVGGLSKLFLWTGTGGLRVDGLPGLLKCLKGGRGLLTVSNHISILDDPILWGVLPWREALLHKKTTRWTLAAADICYTKRLHALFFNLGQNIKTVRGAGCKQEATDKAIVLLRAGFWVHIFSEGKVHQPKREIEDPYDYELLRFKWGAARMLMDADNPEVKEVGPSQVGADQTRLERPWVLPIWITGLDQIFPEKRSFPRFLPRLGARVSITFGAPINERIDPLLDQWRQRRRPAEAELEPYQRSLNDEESTRSRLSSVLREEVARLGRDLKAGKRDGAVDEIEGGFSGKKVEKGDFVTGTRGSRWTSWAGLGALGVGGAHRPSESRSFSSSAQITYAKEAEIPLAAYPDKPNTTHLERTSAEPRGRNIFMAEIISIKKETEQVKSFRFRILASLEDRERGQVQIEPFHFRAGQWLDVHIPGLDVVGGFSLTTSLMEYTMTQGEFELAIQAAKHPPAHWFSTKAVVGSRVAIRVGGHFCWPPLNGLSPLGSHGAMVKHDQVVCIAGGVGINPLISIMEEVMLKNVSAERHVSLKLLYSTKDLDSLLYFERIKKSRLAKDNLRIFFTGLETGSSSTSPRDLDRDLLPNATVFHRRMTDDDLRSAVNPRSQKEDEGGQLFYICGPPEMTDHISQWLVHPEKGRVAKERVHFEKWW